MKIAFIGHRKIDNPEVLREALTIIIEKLIRDEGADTFLFGSRSEFDELSREIVSRLKERYTYIKRVYVRAEYEHVSKEYADYLLESCEQTFFAPRAHGAGAKVYIKRNEEMIDMCDVLVAYFDINYEPKNGKRSGTRMAVEYAVKRNKRIINTAESV